MLVQDQMLELIHNVPRTKDNVIISPGMTVCLPGGTGVVKPMEVEIVDSLYYATDCYSTLEAAEKQTPLEQLKAAILKHRKDVWGDTEVEHMADWELYEALDELDTKTN